MKLLKTLDRYIISKFLGTFFYTIVLILSISIVFDLAENLEEFILRDVPIKKVIMEYYVNFIPYFANLFTSLFTFIAVIYFTSNMASKSEIIAILSSGVTFNRLLKPYLISAFIIASFSFILGNYIIPPANKAYNDFRAEYIDNKHFQLVEPKIHRQIEPGVYIYMQNFNNSNVGYRFTLERFEDAKLVEKLTASNIRWDEDKKKWIINNYWKRIIFDDHEDIVKGYRLDTTLNMVPDDFKKIKNEMQSYTTPALIKEIKSMKMRGVNYIEWEVEKQGRMAGPFSVFILTIMGASLASRKIKGGLGLHLGLGLLLSFSYIFFMRISTVFAISGIASPFFAVWLPNFIFSGIAFITYLWASR